MLKFDILLINQTLKFDILFNSCLTICQMLIVKDTVVDIIVDLNLIKAIMFRQSNVGLVSDDHLIYRIKHTGEVEWEPLITSSV